MKRSRIRPVNPERQERRREIQFGAEAEIVRWMPCRVPGCRGGPPCDPHHEPSRAAGGTAKDLIPLCHQHHLEVHAAGRRTFETAYGINLREETELTAAAVAGHLRRNGGSRRA